MPTWTGLGADDNWSTVGNWDTGVPTATTPALFTGIGPSGNKRCTITAGATCSNLDFTGYTAGVAPNTAVITFTNSLAVRGSITLSPTMGAFAGANGIIINNTGAVTHTSNGFAFNKPLSTTQNGSGGNIVTFVGDWVISSFTINYSGGNPFNFQGAGVITVNGDMSLGQLMTGSNMTFRIAATSTLTTFGAPGSFVGTLNLDSGANTISINNLLLGVSTVNYVSGTIVHTGTLTVGSAVNLNLQNLQFNNYAQNGNTTCTLISDANFNNVSIGNNNGTGVVLNGVGRKMNVRGNFTSSQATANTTGTAKVCLIGSGNINNTTGLSFLPDVELDTVGIYTFTSNNHFRSFKRINGTLNPGLFTVSFASNCILDTSGINWYNVTIIGSTFNSYQLDSLLTVTNNLIISSTTTFIGSYGFTTKNLTCSTPGAIITLQNIIANPLAEYIVTGFLQLLGSAASRISLQAAGRANFIGSIATAAFPTGSTMNVASVTTGTISTGMTVSQATGFIPTGLAPFINDRPTIASGSGLSWVLNKSLVTRVPTPTGTIGLAAGYKAKFTLVNSVTASQSVTYVNTQDIDSSAGQTILVFGSNGDDVNNSTIALFRTLNWGPLVAPSGSVYYTWVE